MQHILGQVRRCVEDYHMIEAGDKVAVGVSGGKDSLLTLTALARLRDFYPLWARPPSSSLTCCVVRASPPTPLMPTAVTTSSSSTPARPSSPATRWSRSTTAPTPAGWAA